MINIRNYRNLVTQQVSDRTLHYDKQIRRDDQARSGNYNNIWFIYALSWKK